MRRTTQSLPLWIALVSVAVAVVAACGEDDESARAPARGGGSGHAGESGAQTGRSHGDASVGGQSTGGSVHQGGAAGSTGGVDGGVAGSAGNDAGGQGGAPLPTGKFVVGFWCGLPSAELTDARMAEIADAGFTVVSNACDGSTYTTAYNTQMTSLAHQHGMESVVTDTRAFEAVAGTNVEANLDGLVADYGALPGLRAYHITDEPNASAFAALAQVSNGLASRDPQHFASINLFPDYASASQLGAATYDAYVASFLTSVKPAFFTYDHYNFLSDGSDGATFFANLAVVRAHALAQNIPFGQYIQSISYNGHRPTNGPEKRWAALHTLAYGGTGVLYFTYWSPTGSPENFGDGIITAAGDRSSQYNDVVSINATLRAMGPYLAAAKSTKVFHNGPLSLATVPRAPGDLAYVPSAAPVTVGLFSVNADAYALVVNRDHTAAVDTDVMFASGTGSIHVLDVGSGLFQPATDAVAESTGVRLHMQIPAGDGRLVHLPGPLGEGPPGAEAYFGTVRADAGWIDVVDSSFGTDRITTAGWGQCPEGTTEVGRDFQSNGFWLCARNDLVSRTFYVGNVVADVGTLYRVEGGTATNIGAGGWDQCTGGTLLAHRFESNGFWVCLQ